MKNIDFTIDENDLKCLYIACKSKDIFYLFTIDCKKSYAEYYQRNLDNIEKYGSPKTFSQWVNRQIIALT